MVFIIFKIKIFILIKILILILFYLKGYVNASLLDFIPFDDCIVDVLHMFIRIGNKLLRLLEERIQEINMFNTLETFISENLNVTNVSFTDGIGRNAMRRIITLTGKQLRKLFSIINLVNLFPNARQINEIQIVILSKNHIILLRKINKNYLYYI